MSEPAVINAPESYAQSEAAVGDYFALLKPRVMSLVIFTAFTGLVIAPGSLHPAIAFAAILFVAIGAGASGALNMWYEADIDAKMARTSRRPIPGGRLDRGAALGFGLTLGIASVIAMGLFVNYLAAGLLAFTIFFYGVVYTMWLKRRTAQNIVIGGVAGALPPVIGWAAVTGGISIEPLVLFALIFFWTPPHFWALSLFCAGDYEKAGIPMLPVTAGEKATRKQIFLYALIVGPAGALPWILGFAGPVYGALSILMGAAFVFGASRVQRDPRTETAKRFFGFSILYLFSLFAALALEALIGRIL